MKYLIGLIVGVLIGWFGVSSSTLHGGALFSSPLAKVYGYVDDDAGCRQIAACLNHAQHNEMLTASFVAKWGNNGIHYCE